MALWTLVAVTAALGVYNIVRRPEPPILNVEVDNRALIAAIAAGAVILYLAR